MSAPAPITKGTVPAWLTRLGVKNGGYFIDSKLRAKRAVTSKGFSPAARIHIYLGLATMGYQQELAVRMEGGKRVPVTPADICAATGIRRENFRRHMTELEGYGLAECKGSTKNRVEIYSWAVPRTVDVKKIVIARDGNFSWCPPDLTSVLKHYRIRFPDDFAIARDDISELERLGRITIQAESSLRAYANSIRARGRPNKEQRNERNIERNPPPSLGRSFSEESAESTDLPTTVVSEENPLKSKIREWMLSNLPVPGFTLEAAELDKIKATIHSEGDLEQFKQAAVRQKDPRGWRVYVRIAEQCAEQRPHYQKAKAAAAGANGNPSTGGSPEREESKAVRELREKEERQKSWPTG